MFRFLPYFVIILSDLKSGGGSVWRKVQKEIGSPSVVRLTHESGWINTLHNVASLYMYTLERTAENSGCAVTRTDDARQPRDTRGIGYIGFSEEHHLLLMEEGLEMDAFYPGVKT
ncbi:hypothetical protein CEXT_47761 [Caerostris extrusa]|uniref:Uncharacterized protein n=1 Tax=Caerostris extrusa TaxID=172846 RepID=A0AAV4UPS6_CAEEX|nr:hypothetical protein CEXT_47761 [Caerostris extrusa]